MKTRVLSFVPFHDTSARRLLEKDELCSHLQVATQLRQESDGRTSLQIRVQVLLELGRHDTCEVGEDAGSNVDLTQHVHLQQGCK